MTEIQEDPHKTVLLDRAVDCLIKRPGGCYVDGTFGRGGHSRLILSRLAAEGRLLAMDRDPQAVAAAAELAASDSRFSIHHGAFSGLQACMGEQKIDGLLLDLGVSSPQLDEAGRGFSFLRDGPLDMRMDTSRGISAREWLAQADEQEITVVLKTLGEEKFGRRMARALVEAREKEPLVSTTQLADILAHACPVWPKKIHPATRAFQGIRIFVNSELDELSQVLDASLSVLKPGGRLVVISFHSLEDRLVKRFIRRHSRGDELPDWVPVTQDQLSRRLVPVGKACKASPGEVESNPRARSAVMRVAERLP
ncbi:MAG: 16S rRNA (cytosine(1402)-N(4))-methyltransferase RsmH [Kistimonas sp.]|nr:16S rRNA (cytosine(1402)-N(4))-methyltransferase RsmH [Kistimonas sp.]